MDSLKEHHLHHYFDVQKPWLVYWIVNGLYLLDSDVFLPKKERKSLAVYILDFQHKEQGGFAGGIGYQPNVISTYAAVLSLISVGEEEDWKKIDRESMCEFLIACRSEKTKGAFMVHEFGEIDIRCTYAAVLIGKLLGIKDERLYDGVKEYILSCQTYEGGFGPVFGIEAHGGYTFCALAALALLDSIDEINLDTFLYWITNKQVDKQGGFCGRTNKLVDSCYTFWQGASFSVLSEHHSEFKNNKEPVYNTEALQKYVLLCCQGKKGGLKDKPGKNVDLYHSMYSLAGLSLSYQYYKEDEYMKPIDPVSNVSKERVERFRKLFN